MEYLLSFLPSTPYLLPVVLTILALVVLWFGLPQRGCRRTNCKLDRGADFDYPPRARGSQHGRLRSDRSLGADLRASAPSLPRRPRLASYEGQPLHSP